MSRTPKLVTLALALSAHLLGSCAQIETDILIDAEQIDDPCLQARFPWRARLGTLTMTPGDVALLKFEASEGPPTFDDSLAITVLNGSDLAREGSGVVPVAPSYVGERGQGTIVLPITCPDENSAMWVLEGELTFDRVHASNDEEVAGHFEGRLLDGHHLERVAATGVRVDFRFPFKSWRPFQVFSPMP